MIMQLETVRIVLAMLCNLNLIEYIITRIKIEMIRVCWYKKFTIFISIILERLFSIINIKKWDSFHFLFFIFFVISENGYFN